MSIAQFNDLAIKTGDTIVGSEDHMLNLVQARAHTPAFLIAGKSAEEVFESSPTLRDILYLKKEDRGQRYDIADLDVNFTNPQVGTPATAEWSFYYNYMAWSKPEIELNATSDMGPKFRRTRYKKVLRGKQQNLWQSMIDQMEDECWAAADDVAMRTTYKAPMSIPYFITEETGGVPLDAQTGAPLASGSVMGISPATYPTWDNHRLRYTSTGLPVDGGTDFISKCVAMTTKLGYRKIRGLKEHGEGETRSDVAFISDTGLGYLTAALRLGQDQWNSRELANGDLMLSGVAYQNIPSLDTAAVYTDGAGGLATEEKGGAASNTGPRVYFCTKDALKPFFFKGQHFSVDDPVNLTAIGKPNNWVQGANIWNQLWCGLRNRLGIVSPTGAL